MHLRFDMITAYHSGATEHPQKVMKDLGITYEDATPQSIADQWWFWNCENVPDTLPRYLSELNVDPKKHGIKVN
jgi:hypothetical protein